MENHLGRGGEGRGGEGREWRGGEGKGGEGVEGRDQMFHKEAMIKHPCMPGHSLVANVLPIVISKVVTIKDPSRLNEDSNTSEHHVPGVPAHMQGSTDVLSARTYMHVCGPCTSHEQLG